MVVKNKTQVDKSTILVEYMYLPGCYCNDMQCHLELQAGGVQNALIFSTADRPITHSIYVDFRVT